MKIVISPYSQKMRDGKLNPKNYPYWKQVIEGLKDHELIQIGVNGEEKLVEDCLFSLSQREIREATEDADLFISVDNFAQHFFHYYGKRGIVIFGKSNPSLFGYPENINLLKDRKYLREKQFDIWEAEEFSEDVFVSPEVVIQAVNTFKKPL